MAISLALNHNAYILSLDSLSIYHEIDIASAKPCAEELAQVEHFGVNICEVDTHFNVADYFDIYIDAKNKSIREGKNLIIVGGSGFYLKMLLDGLSAKVEVSQETYAQTQNIMSDLDEAYAFVKQKDSMYAAKISSHDRYRIEKWFLLYFESGIISTEYFTQHKPRKIIENLPIFEIDVTRETLASRIVLRTQKMLSTGLIDEVVTLEKRYTRAPNAMKSIGIKEVCDYLDGKLDMNMLEESIVKNTRKLAKRQQVFNKTQFANRHLLRTDLIEGEVENIFD